jgi:hypothetical protein
VSSRGSGGVESFAGPLNELGLDGGLGEFFSVEVNLVFSMSLGFEAKELRSARDRRRLAKKNTAMKAATAINPALVAPAIAPVDTELCWTGADVCVVELEDVLVDVARSVLRPVIAIGVMEPRLALVFVGSGLETVADSAVVGSIVLVHVGVESMVISCINHRTKVRTSSPENRTK